jgi:feruloyl esterase
VLLLAADVEKIAAPGRPLAWQNLRMKHLLIGLAVAAALATALAGRGVAAASAKTCEQLATTALPNATITLAASVDAGAFVPPGNNAAARQAASALPAFCRIAATLKPGPESDIKIEVWMPAANWNGKFQAVGNGAFSGAIAYPAMMTALRRGYATASTDTGHEGDTASFALSADKLTDFGWRAVHEMTVASKKLVASHYEQAPKLSYWNGCSAGGRQAMKEAQRFPADFDGIIAGAPGLDWTGRSAMATRVAHALQKDEAARLGPAQFKLVHQAVLEACDANDGVKDGVLDDPRKCKFDPGVLQCKGSADAGCLTPAQVNTVQMLYADEVNPKTHRRIAGLQRGSELGWTDMGWTASARATGLSQFRFIVFKDPQWEIDRFNFPADIVRADEIDNGTLNALDSNLQPFISRGGKLIQYHGWSDPQISPTNSADYYESVLKTVGGPAKVAGSYRLFMAPGMGHCAGGDGPNTFDMVGALEQWVEQGKAPDSIIASHAANGRVDRTRPLCPYPQVAEYKGSGSTDDAANFVCKVK